MRKRQYFYIGIFIDTKDRKFFIRRGNHSPAASCFVFEPAVAKLTAVNSFVDEQLLCIPTATQIVKLHS